MSDLHVTAPGTLAGGVIETAPYVQAAVAHVNSLDPRPDLTLITGDLVDNGGRAEYECLVELLAPLATPLVLLPGNHDDPAELRRAFPEQSWAPDAPGLCQVIEDHAVRVVALDSVVTGQPQGRLGPERLAWADRTLSADRRPTVVAVHHPPFSSGIEHMDGMGLEDGAELAGVLAGHDHVVRVVSGHLHRSITAAWGGTVVTVVPGVAHQVGLDLRAGAAVSLTLEPPAVGLHLWRPGLPMVSHLSPIGTFPDLVRDGRVIEPNPLGPA